MADPGVLRQRPGGARLEPVRIGVRLAERVGAAGGPLRSEFARDSLLPGERRVGPIGIGLERVDHGDAATLAVRVRNTSQREEQLEAVVLGFRWRRPGKGPLRFLRHGWQSWSFTGTRELDAAGEPAFPSGDWLRGFYHALGSPPPDRAGWHESDIVTVAGGTAADGDPAACCVGVLETGRCFGVVYLREVADAVEIEVELCPEVPLAPGEGRVLESLRVALGPDEGVLLESFAELWGRRAGARTASPFQAGWCSWYHFFHDVTERDVLRNLEVLSRERSALPLDVFQLDDGYQRAIGDWLETNEKFPRGLAPLARDIASAGFRPGLWTAPFCAVAESRVFQEHGDWLLRQDGAPFRGTVNPVWSREGWAYALDPTHEEVDAHLRALFRALVQMGFTYLKLDFLHVVSNRAEARDARATRAERLRRGLLAVRAGAGEDALLLGCGCPLGPAVGLVDAMRIGPDVAPTWEAQPPVAIPGIEPALPSLRSALRSVVHRAWMHRRLWLNDPDCVMARSEHTKLSPEEIEAFAAATAATGGLVVISDDLPVLSEADRARVRRTLATAREVDAAGSRGVARTRDLLGPEPVETLVATLGTDALVGVWNAGDSPRDVRAPLARLGVAGPGAPVERVLGGAAENAPEDDALRFLLAPHAAALVRLPEARELAVFCDFDGTFSVQDVGATLVRMHAGDRRPALWARYERGEIAAWDYNMELLDGLALPEPELDAFLETIELDPGARHLVRWCEKRGVHFEILSDGFDHNLERLQRMHDLRFRYASNRLRYEGDAWRIRAGHPNPDCPCGTGTCKRGRIAAHRRERPGALCVHVGNGRVSDLCGALEADLAFAKDTLAPALAERGRAYEPFETLHDVVARLEELFPLREVE